MTRYLRSAERPVWLDANNYEWKNDKTPDLTAFVIGDRQMITVTEVINKICFKPPENILLRRNDQS